jgi:hypothetical protein
LLLITPMKTAQQNTGGQDELLGTVQDAANYFPDRRSGQAAERVRACKTTGC